MRTRYSYLAMLLHWGMALAFITMIGAGLWMTGAIKDPATQALAFDVYQLHKSAGFTVFLLAGIRVATRAISPPPPLPQGISVRDALLAKLGHWGLYGLMFALPITGWMMVSASIWGLPTIWFGLFEIPHLGFIESLPLDEKKPAEETLKAVHMWLAYVFIALISVHVLATLKHQFYEKIPLLARMGISSKL